MTGKVYLVGAGPGDPDLLTVKAVRLLRTADAVLYDDLVSQEILNLVSPAAQLHNVGKRCGKKKIQQEEIHFLMVALAESGMQVLRLKSGDPMIFGRAGEEIEALRHANIPCEVIPGVTSAFGAAASAEIPLTHRRLSSAVVFVTAHQACGKQAADWSKLVSSGSTLVIYMPGQDYGNLSENLRASGLPTDTPCAIVSRASTARQQCHRTSIAELATAPHLDSPTLLIVGDVVRLGNIESASEFQVTHESKFPSEASSSRAEEVIA